MTQLAQQQVLHCDSICSLLVSNLLVGGLLLPGVGFRVVSISKITSISRPFQSRHSFTREASDQWMCCVTSNRLLSANQWSLEMDTFKWAQNGQNWEFRPRLGDLSIWTFSGWIRCEVLENGKTRKQLKGSYAFLATAGVCQYALRLPFVAFCNFIKLFHLCFYFSLSVPF